ncbi:hypothetical protein RTP6_004472 [Batrachochytrium dendrobatidis]
MSNLEKDNEPDSPTSLYILETHDYTMQPSSSNLNFEGRSASQNDWSRFFLAAPLLSDDPVYLHADHIEELDIPVISTVTHIQAPSLFDPSSSLQEIDIDPVLGQISTVVAQTPHPTSITVQATRDEDLNSSISPFALDTLPWFNTPSKFSTLTTASGAYCSTLDKGLNPSNSKASLIPSRHASDRRNIEDISLECPTISNANTNLSNINEFNLNASNAAPMLTSGFGILDFPNEITGNKNYSSANVEQLQYCNFWSTPVPNDAVFARLPFAQATENMATNDNPSSSVCLNSWKENSQNDTLNPSTIISGMLAENTTTNDAIFGDRPEISDSSTRSFLQHYDHDINCLCNVCHTIRIQMQTFGTMYEGDINNASDNGFTTYPISQSSRFNAPFESDKNLQFNNNSSKNREYLLARNIGVNNQTDKTLQQFHLQNTSSLNKLPTQPSLETLAFKENAITTLCLSNLSPTISEQHLASGYTPKFEFSSTLSGVAHVPGSLILAAMEISFHGFWNRLRTPDDMDIQSQSVLVEKFLGPRNVEYTVLLIHPRVVQKSYGKEKRFFCPQPIIYLIGAGWPKLIGDIKNKDGIEQIHPHAKASFVDNNHISWTSDARLTKNQFRYTAVSPTTSSNTKKVTKQRDAHNINHRDRTRSSSSSKSIEVIDHDSDTDDSRTVLDGEFLSSRHGVKCNLEMERRRVNLLSKTSSYGRCATPSMQGPIHCMSAYTKGLYISDFDNRKSFHLNFRIYGNVSKEEVCRIRSKEIKVISKPSRNKSVAKSSENIICSGHYIALFNRVRSQTISTRYMSVSQDGSKLTSRHTPWDTFIIWLESDPVYIARKANFDGNNKSVVSDDVRSLDFESNSRKESLWNVDGENSQLFKDKPESTIHYGNTVVLENLMTGLLTVPLIVRRVNGKSMAVVQESDSPTLASEFTRASLFLSQDHCHGNIESKTKDAVSQLHKISFQVKSQPGHYISLRDESIVIYQAQSSLSQPDDKSTLDMAEKKTDHQFKASDSFKLTKPLLPLQGKSQHAHKEPTLKPLKRPLQNTVEASKKRLKDIQPIWGDASNISMPQSKTADFSVHASQYKTDYSTKNSTVTTEDITELSVWSIVGTEVVEHTFSLPPDDIGLDSDTISPTTLKQTSLQPTTTKIPASTQSSSTENISKYSSILNSPEKSTCLGAQPMPIIDRISQEGTNVLVCIGSQFGVNFWIFAGIVPAKRMTIRSTFIFMAEFQCPIEIIRHSFTGNRDHPSNASKNRNIPFTAATNKANNKPEPFIIDQNDSNACITEIVPLLVLRDKMVFRTEYSLQLQWQK